MGKARKRKNAKKYTFSTFESDIFEGEFKLPLVKQMPLSFATRFRNGDIIALFEWLESVGVSREDIEAIESLDAEEFKAFSETWENGSLGK